LNTEAPSLYSSTGASAQHDLLRRELTVFDATSIVVGTIIGSAIFLVPSTIAGRLGSPLWVLAAWIVGGVLSLCGALSIAEVGSMYPGAGGLYVYLREAYGPQTAFLYGWGLFTMIQSGSIAALAVAFHLFAARLLPLKSIEQKFVSLACIALLTTINCFGVRLGKLVQNTLTLTKLAGLLLMICLLFASGTRSRIPHLRFTGSALHLSVSSFGIALIAMLWAYEGWHVISFAAAEIKRPQRDLPRSLFYGLLIVTFVYVLANASYYVAMSPDEIRNSSSLASEAMTKAYGVMAGKLLALLILMSLLGALNGLILTGPRVYYAMAKDRVFFSQFAQNSKYGTPVFALIAQGTWAAVLMWSGTYEQLFTYVIFTGWMFYGLTAAGVIILRRRRPHCHRPFAVPGYPWVPLLFCAATAGLVLATIASGLLGALIGIALLLTGVPIYWIFKLRLKEQPLTRSEVM
jgi:basic amino acid/polyamine antiporter, APA family